MIKCKEDTEMSEDKKLNPEELENVAGGYLAKRITCPNCGEAFFPNLYDGSGYSLSNEVTKYKCPSCGHEWARA